MTELEINALNYLGKRMDGMCNGKRNQFPAYLCDTDSVAAVNITFFNLMDQVELPCKDFAIKKALCRLGADSIKDCKVEVDSTRDIFDQWSEKISEAEMGKNIFGLNNLLKSKDIRLAENHKGGDKKRETCDFFGFHGAFLLFSDSLRTKMAFMYNLAHFIFQVNIDNKPFLCYNKNNHKRSAAKLRYRF